MAGNHGDHLKVTYASLEDAAGAIRTEAKHLEEDLNQVKGIIKKIANGWSGEAGEAYFGVQRKWDAKADALVSRLRVIAKGVTLASANYKGTDKKAAGQFDVSDWLSNR